MTIGAVHQFVSSLVPRDAIGAHALEARSVLREMGLRSEIFVKETRAEMVTESRFYRSFTPSEPSLLVYQAATGSAVAEFLAARAEPLIVNYHNVTPPEFFAAWEPHTAVELEVGRRQVSDLAARADLGLAVSRFNQLDLRSLGYERTAVSPVLLDPRSLERPAAPAEADRLEQRRAAAGGGPMVLFVGRLAPNKAQHDLVKAVAAYRRLYGGGLSLVLIGAPASPRYQRALRGLVAGLDLDAAVELAGAVTDGALAAAYQAADVFVSVSDHEGFCVPILEAMHHRVPIVAYAAGAVPETVGDGGLLLPEKDPTVIAAAIHRVTTDRGLRDRLVAAGQARLADLSIDNARAQFRAVMEAELALVGTS